MAVASIETTADDGFVDNSSEIFFKPSISPSGWSRQVAADLVAVGDIAAILLGVTLPAYIYSSVGNLDIPATSILRIGLISSIIVYVCLNNWGLYSTAKMNDFPLHPGALLMALAIAVLAVLGLGLPFTAGDYIHVWYWSATWLSASYLLLLTNRVFANAVLKKMTKAGRFDMQVAVFGAGTIARRVRDHLSNPALGINFVGVFDDRHGQARLNTHGLEITGKVQDLIATGRAGNIDQIIVALPPSADGRMATIVKQLEQLPVSVHVVTHIASDLIEECPAHKVSSLGPVGLLDVKAKPLSDWAPTLKRVEDYGLGTLLFLISLPLLCIIGLLIKLDSPGPALFRQRRGGLNQQEIEVFKFRTMIVQEDGSDVQQATENDPRVTRVGWLLRRTSLDELPQLLNVLRGEMSLVGPRPHAIIHDQQWSELLQHYVNRHQVKPGITGLAQVRGFRGRTIGKNNIEDRVSNDLEYIANWSLWLDMKIITRTIWAITIGKNAH